MRWLDGYGVKSPIEGTVRHSALHIVLIDRIIKAITKINITSVLIGSVLLLVQGAWMGFLVWALVLRYLFPNFLLPGFAP
jgi:hypothetical protein